MFVLKPIGPVVVNKQTQRFLVGDKLGKEIIEHLRKVELYDELCKNGIIGEKKNESIRSSESGQPGYSDEAGRSDAADDSDKSASSGSGGNKRSGKGKTD